MVSSATPINGATIGDLIRLHRSDYKELGRALGRSKQFTLEKLEVTLGHLRRDDLTRERLIAFAKTRKKEGAAPVTIGMDFSYLRTVILHAAALHGIEVSVEQIGLARAALNMVGLIGKAKERDRRPTEDEIERITAYLDGNQRQVIPVGRIIRFAISTAMRIEEICRSTWEGLDSAKHLILVRDRKHPREKQGNHQSVPLVALTGFDALAIIDEQASSTGRRGRIFPYSSRSAGSAFRRACRALNIVDLHFHDLRHEATSRLFEAGLTIPEVSMITGHKDWKMLRRYLHLKPEEVARKGAVFCAKTAA